MILWSIAGKYSITFSANCETASSSLICSVSKVSIIGSIELLNVSACSFAHEANHSPTAILSMLLPFENLVIPAKTIVSRSAEESLEENVISVKMA